MGYIEKNMITGERIVFRTGRHWIVLLGPALFGGLLIYLGLFMLVTGVASKDGGTTGMALFVAGVGVLVISLAVVSRNATQMAVTNKRLVVKVGILRNKTIELFLPKVESIGVERGLFGRMLGYGDIVVRGTGGTAEPFKKIRSPLEFRRQVQQQSEAPQ